MFSFVFGLVWTAIVTPIFVLSINITGGIGIPPSLIVFFILFEGIGLFMIIKGLIKIIKDWKTKKHGIQCYGIVNDIQNTGSYINGRPEYMATLDFLNPETNRVETIEEIIGFDYNKYPLSSYVLCKYYEGDINLENPISENEIPENIKINLIPKNQPFNYSSIEFSEDREYVTIDGVQYKRIQ